MLRRVKYWCLKEKSKCWILASHKIWDDNMIVKCTIKFNSEVMEQLENLSTLGQSWVNRVIRREKCNVR